MGAGSSVTRVPVTHQHLVAAEASLPLDGSDLLAADGSIDQAAAVAEVVRLRALLQDAASEADIEAKIAPGLVDYLSDLFLQNDQDQSGLLDVDEFWALLSHDAQLRLEDETIESLRQHADANGDGQISWREFLSASHAIWAEQQVDESWEWSAETGWHDPSRNSEGGGAETAADGGPAGDAAASEAEGNIGGREEEGESRSRSPASGQLKRANTSVILADFAATDQIVDEADAIAEMPSQKAEEGADADACAATADAVEEAGEGEAAAPAAAPAVAGEAAAATEAATDADAAASVVVVEGDAAPAAAAADEGGTPAEVVAETEAEAAPAAA
tara:strand:+ start:2097 stop:3092 length:996 start_codon:yes stop_codon:yes gene_type:complete